MRTLRWLVLLSASLLAALPASSQDHLLPEPSDIGGDNFGGDYQAMVADIFHEAYDHNVTLRMVEEPSFSPEYVVGIKQDKDASIFTIAPDKLIWSYESLKGMESGLLRIVDAQNKKAQQEAIDEIRGQLPRDYHDLKLHRCQIGIDPDLAGRITKVWRNMLLETQFVQPVRGPDGKEVRTETIGSDGVIYHFSMRDRGDVLAGQIWSPFNNKPAALVEIAETMAEYCEAKDNKVLAKLSGKVDALAVKFRDR
jgi:hypothetical protein